MSFVLYKQFKIILKQSGVDPKDPTPEGDVTTPEDSLTLVSNLLLVVVNIGLDILGNLTKLNITKYWAEVDNIELKYWV